MTASYPGLSGRTAIVTGGASGIGAAIVRGFVRAGARVAFLDIQDEAGRAMASETGALFLRCDLLDLAALKESLATAQARLGSAGVLVNNAANDQRQSFEVVTPESFDWMMGVNFRHVFFACQAVLPAMRAAGGGAIVNMSSGVWMGGGNDMEAYSAAKAAIVGLTNSLARDYGRHRIRVNAVAPGMITTERQRRLWYPDESAISAGLARQCTPDPVTEADVAEVVLFLASDAARGITKQLIPVNGGLR
ncbi:MAG: SDR family oxidoreductase [Alphaproteobacteria bacterium]|nr:SDR family oxidoreductase [Alphaproteobacteria bacterium]